VQNTISPPPEKPLARIRLCVNGKAAVFTPNIKLTLRVPKVTNITVPVAGDSSQVSGMKEGNGDGADNLELEVMMEADDDNASDAEEGLACCARKQAAGMLEEYEEDGQRLPGDEDYQREGEEDELTDDDIDIIHDAERLAQQQDEAASDPEDESDDDESSDGSSDESSAEDDDRDGDFIPRLRLKGKDKPKAVKTTGGKKRARKVEKDTSYTFCPLPHRLSILRLMCKHFCQHPILPERHGQARTAKQIHRDAVLETYYHCKANNLCEVWAYLWTNWYTTEKWTSWARSSHEHAIPRKRTTMLVESLWRNFKRMVLHHFNRPRVDFATYALVTQGLAPYRVRFNQIMKNPRDGRARRLRGEQIPIKRAWLALRQRPIKGVYDTNVKHWLCSCGAQKYHSYLLCKHLVQALPLPSADWWTTIVRRHTAPFYDIRELLPENERVIAPSPAALGPLHWLRRDCPVSRSCSPLTASQNLVSSNHDPSVLDD
jgi:hypothetical protein